MLISKTKNKARPIRKRLEKQCSICGKTFKLISYTDCSYRGGKYFGKVPLFTRKEMKRVHKLGTKMEKLDTREIQVLKKDPKPYGYAEYWECAKCYWK